MPKLRRDNVDFSSEDLHQVLLRQIKMPPLEMLVRTLKTYDVNFNDDVL